MAVRSGDWFAKPTCCECGFGATELEEGGPVVAQRGGGHRIIQHSPSGLWPRMEEILVAAGRAQGRETSMLLFLKLTEGLISK